MIWQEQHPAVIEQQIEEATLRLQAAQHALRPSTLYRPWLYRVGDVWHASYTDSQGDPSPNIDAIGATPALAFAEFDRIWQNGK